MPPAPPPPPQGPTPAGLLDGLAAIDAVQRGVRDLVLAATPRISWVRLVLFPTFLMLLGSEAARDRRGDGLNDLLLAAYVLLAVGGLLAEGLRLQRTGLTSTRRRLPRAGRRQLAGAAGVAAAIIATGLVGAATDRPWVGLPIGLASAGFGLWARARWAMAFRSPEALRLPGPPASGAFAAPAALRLGAALALADRVRPAVLEERLGLTDGGLTRGVAPLEEAGLARVLHPDPDGRAVVTFTAAGRRAWRAQLAALRRG